MKLKAVIMILFFLIFFTACQSDKYKYLEDLTASTNSLAYQDNYNIYYSLSNYKLKKYEPVYGCYSGAYILADKSIGYDISQFELKTSQHASYKYHLNLGDEFPLSWILECYKNSKLPFIILSPENNKSPFDYEIITDYAKKFGEIDIPTLIGFYPEPVKNGYPAEVYKKFFAYAKSEFSVYAPNTAFVFITNSNDVYKTDDYFPEDNAVDWVGIDLYLNIENNSIKNSELLALNYFYDKFQSKYPIMISSLGISNYTADSHTYHTSNAAYEIENFYTEIKNKYCRIKAVYYMDFDNSSIFENSNPNSFLITNNDEVTESYKKMIKSSHFEKSFKKDKNENSEYAAQKILSKKLAVMINKDFYIPCSLAINLGFLKDDFSNIIINGEYYTNLSKVAEINTLNISKEKNFIYISN